jgi:D-glycero-D-manno-heptose 1,7-bisphosphate phosphatase
VERLAAAGFAPIVVTNQSAIARGLLTEGGLARIHGALHERLGRWPCGYLHCPHHPDQGGPYGGPCSCRKPRSGLLRQAAGLFGLRLDRSFCVGDSARDILMAKGLGVRAVLVRSGHPWRAELEQLDVAGLAPDHVADDVAAAASWILDQPAG